jgi:preprotein translocase subunit SecE
MTNKLFKYFREAKQELTKVTWPSKKVTTSYSLIVVGICLAVGVFFFILDKLFTQGLAMLINL